MSKHTPGPWVAFDGEVVGDGGEGRTIVHIHGDSEDGANVPLIAAAPELLEACRAVMEDFYQAEQDGLARLDAATTDKVLAAIAKAEGRE